MLVLLCQCRQKLHNTSKRSVVMKRALAERAKQSGLPNGVGSPSEESCPLRVEPEVSTADMASQPSSKMARVASSSVKTASASISSSPSVAVSVLGRSKRLRDGGTLNSFAGDSANDDDDSTFSAFYLRHQNRALASELSSLKYQLSQMKRERDYRRTQCRKACQSLNSLQATWTQMESALQHGQPLRGDILVADENHGNPKGVMEQFGDMESVDSTSIDPPFSSGSGKSAELVGALLDSLAELGSVPHATSHGTDEYNPHNEGDEYSVSSSESAASDIFRALQEPPAHIDGNERHQLDDLLRISDNVSRRADLLQRWIWSLLELVDHSRQSSPLSKDSSKVEIINKLSRQLARKEAKAKRLEAQLKEVARARNEMKASDRRVRRGLYRLAAGRVELKDVLKAIERSDEDKEAAMAWMENAGISTGTGMSSAPDHREFGGTVATGTVTEARPSDPSGSGGSRDGEKTLNHSHCPNLSDASQLAQMQRRVSELEQLSSSRDEQIQKLLKEREEQMKRINSLVLKDDIYDAATEPSDQDVERSSLYAEVRAKLTTSERRLKDQEKSLKLVKEEWSQALGNVELARTTMAELQSKHARKWTELTLVGASDDGQLSHSTTVGGAAHDRYPKDSASPECKDDAVSQKAEAEQLVSLRHKLTQAMENVRQAETTRNTLSEAVIMNESLQAKLEEVKAKYGALQAGRSSVNHQSASALSTMATGKTKSSAASSSTSSSLSAEKTEKLHRDYRRIRKELAAVTASKEAAKAKLERTEKERDALVQTNARLLKQTAEKDEMNVKSLSTILHLKQVTEQITKEKNSLELQAKSAHQLALSARLATNARDRLQEEFIKESQALGKCVEDWEQKYASLARENEWTNEKMQQQKAKESTLLREFAAAKTRCEELVSQSTKLREEKKVVVESLAIAQREAAEATKRADAVIKQRNVGSDVQSEFTVGQLTTQVSVLKGRLACPVCNHRDKKCILMRCRHMFCKPCVDENIKNRSRKCPACGGRFDTKDVADVWL